MGNLVSRNQSPQIVSLIVFITASLLPWLPINVLASTVFYNWYQTIWPESLILLFFHPVLFPAWFWGAQVWGTDLVWDVLDKQSDHHGVRSSGGGGGGGSEHQRCLDSKEGTSSSRQVDIMLLGIAVWRVNGYTLLFFVYSLIQIQEAAESTDPDLLVSMIYLSLLVVVFS